MKKLLCVSLLLCCGCLVGCGSDPAFLLFGVDLALQTEIQDVKDQVGELEDRLDNLPVPQDGIDGVTTVIVVHDRVLVPVLVRPIVQIDPVCIEVDLCHKGRTISICVGSVNAHLANHEEDYLGACE